MRNKIMTAIIVLLCTLILIGFVLLGYMIWAVYNGQFDGWGTPQGGTVSAAEALQATPYTFSYGSFYKGI
ncbi:MAG: cbb3-type cytochrome oxidase assembly protein CcoS [Clostridia bacterium]|nr:cbb3-type cytochrome oxidase assembly protein CcoS [Clostridia bacterium]